MKIVVCMKVVAKTSDIVVSMGQVDDYGAEREFSLADRYALETAKALKPDELIVVGLAAPEHEAVLRQAMAFGATRGIRVNVPDAAAVDHDPLAVAKVLAGVVGPLEPHFVVTGEASADQRRAAVGPMVASLLGLDFVPSVTSATLDGTTLALERWVGPGEAESCTLQAPAVFSVVSGQARLPRPSAIAVARSTKMPFEVADVEQPRPSLRLQSLAPATERVRSAEVLQGTDLSEDLAILKARLRERRVL